MSRSVFETVIGAVVLLIAALFLGFAYSSTHFATSSGYEISGKFDRVDGLNNGSDVRISGVKVGSVTSQELDPKSYLAVVHMSIDPSIKLPLDTVAVVSSESLLGGRYMALQPGADSEMIPAGGTLEYTQSTPGLEQLIGQFIFSQSGKKDGDAGKDAEAPAGDGDADDLGGKAGPVKGGLLDAPTPPAN